VPDRFFVSNNEPDAVLSLYRKQDQLLALVEVLYEF
jgi:hypothetical protein